MTLEMNKQHDLDLMQIVPNSIKPYFYIEGRISKTFAGGLVLHKIRDFFIAVNVMFILKPTSKILTQFQHRLVIKVERKIFSHDFCFSLLRFCLLSLEVAGFWTGGRVFGLFRAHAEAEIRDILFIIGQNDSHNN